MPDPLRYPWTRLALMAVFLTPLAVEFLLESKWLIQAGFILLFVFILAVTGYEMRQWRKREEIRENMRRIW
jgi:hypothetical protein